MLVKSIRVLSLVVALGLFGQAAPHPALADGPCPGGVEVYGNRLHATYTAPLGQLVSNVCLLTQGSGKLPIHSGMIGVNGVTTPDGCYLINGIGTGQVRIEPTFVTSDHCGSLLHVDVFTHSDGRTVVQVGPQPEIVKHSPPTPYPTATATRVPTPRPPAKTVAVVEGARVAAPSASGLGRPARGMEGSSKGMTDEPASRREVDQRFEAMAKHIDFRADALEALVNSRFVAANHALEKADEAMGIRLESMNEFRRQIEQERALYARRDVINPKIEQLEVVVGRMAGRNLGLLGIALTGGISIGAVIGAAAIRLLVGG